MSTFQQLKLAALGAAPAPLILTAAPVDGVQHIAITHIYAEDNEDFFAASANWSGLVNGRDRYVYYGDEGGTEEDPSYNTCEVHWSGSAWIASGNSYITAEWQLTGVGDVATPDLVSSWAGSNDIGSSQTPVVTITQPTAGTAGSIGQLGVFGSEFYKCWNASPPRWTDEVTPAEIASLTAALGTFTNNGSFSMDSGSSVTLDNYSTISVSNSDISVTNNGYVSVTNDSDIIMDSGSSVTLDNYGSVSVTNYGSVSVTGGSVSVTGGTITIADASTLSLQDECSLYIGDAGFVTGSNHWSLTGIVSDDYGTILDGHSYTVPTESQSGEIYLDDNDNGTAATFTLNVSARLAAIPIGSYLAVTFESTVTALTITHTGTDIYGTIPTTMLAGHTLIITKILAGKARISSN